MVTLYSVAADMEDSNIEDGWGACATAERETDDGVDADCGNADLTLKSFLISEECS